MVPEDEVYLHSGKYKHNRAIIIALLPKMMEVRLLTGRRAGKTIRVNQTSGVVVEAQYRTRNPPPRQIVTPTVNTENVELPVENLVRPVELTEVDIPKVISMVQGEILEIQNLNQTLAGRTARIIELMERLHIHAMEHKYS